MLIIKIHFNFNILFIYQNLIILRKKFFYYSTQNFKILSILKIIYLELKKS
jgi:hypothetical protein